MTQVCALCLTNTLNVGGTGRVWNLGWWRARAVVFSGVGSTQQHLRGPLSVRFLTRLTERGQTR